MQDLPKSIDKRLVIGAEGFSDAGVFEIAPDLLMVQSLDFFAPLVDDPYIFGQIAAANSLSDVFAMGGVPATALNIVCFPDDKLGLDVLSEILRGDQENCRQRPRRWSPFSCPGRGILAQISYELWNPST